MEQENGDFDVVDCETGRSNELNVYHTKILPDLKTKDFKTMSFRCDSVFSELRSTEEFYIRVGQPLVLAAKNGGNSTFVMYGSSGSGKSHTMTDIEERAVYDIFGESSGEPSQQVFAQYVELSGNQCYDLLGPVGRFVRVVDKGGYFGFRGALSRPASNARDLLSILSDAKRRAATQNTIRKHSESQSYLLCQIKIGQERSQGCLTLLECASYEHVRHVESSGDTNEATSFDALFDSIQSKASCKAATKSLHIKHNVTKILNESLKSETSGVCVVATLAPNATATESTLSTLSSLQKLMTGSTENDQSTICSPSNDETSTEDLILPRQWSHSELVNWMAR